MKMGRVYRVYIDCANRLKSRVLAQSSISSARVMSLVRIIRVGVRTNLRVVFILIGAVVLVGLIYCVPVIQVQHYMGEDASL
jgi:hypothetical protein